METDIIQTLRAYIALHGDLEAACSCAKRDPVVLALAGAALVLGAAAVYSHSKD